MKPEIRKLSINHISLKNHNFEDRMKYLYEEKIPATAVWFDDIKKIGIKRTKQIFNKYPVEIVLGAYIGPFNQANKAEYQKSRKEDEEKIEIANELGIDTVLALTGPLGNINYDYAINILTEGLKEADEVIRNNNFDIRIAFEPIHYIYQKDWTYICTIEDSLRIVDKINRSKIGLMIDLCHVWQEPDVLNWIKKAKNKIFGCQICDWRKINRTLYDRVLMGDGCIPIREMLDAIEQAGWNKWYDVEIFSEELWKLDAKEFIKKCKEKYKNIWIV